MQQSPFPSPSVALRTPPKHNEKNRETTTAPRRPAIPSGNGLRRGRRICRHRPPHPPTPRRRLRLRPQGTRRLALPPISVETSTLHAVGKPGLPPGVVPPSGSGWLSSRATLRASLDPRSLGVRSAWRRPGPAGSLCSARRIVLSGGC